MTLPPSLPLDAELTELLEPTSEGADCGIELDGTLELSAFEMAVREPEVAPIAGVERQDERDWRAIDRSARELLRTSKDLRVAVQLARARCHTQGLPAFCQALCFIGELARRYWADVYPPGSSQIDGVTVHRLAVAQPRNADRFNALLFWAMELVVPGFSVDGFFSALLGAVVISILSWLIQKVL